VASAPWNFTRQSILCLGNPWICVSGARSLEYIAAKVPRGFAVGRSYAHVRYGYGAVLLERCVPGRSSPAWPTGLHEAEYDAEGKPITAVGCRFRPCGLSGCDQIRRLERMLMYGGPEKTLSLNRTLRVGLIDFDTTAGSIFISSTAPHSNPRWQGKPRPRRALHNNRDGPYRCDREGGVANDRWGFGVTVGDFDNMAGPTSLLRITARTGSIAITTTVRLPMWPRRPRDSRNWSDGAAWAITTGWRLDRSCQLCAFRPRQPSLSAQQSGDMPLRLPGWRLTCGPRGLVGNRTTSHNNATAPLPRERKSWSGRQEQVLRNDLHVIDIDGNGKPDCL